MNLNALSLVYLTADAVSCISSWKELVPCIPVRKSRRMGCRQLMEKRKEMSRATRQTA